MFSLDKNLKKVILICAVVILSALFFSSFGFDGGKDNTAEKDLETLLCRIEGVEEVSVVYYYSSSEELEGIAVVYQGSKSSEVSEKIYELVNSLYGIPYNHIFVSN